MNNEIQFSKLDLKQLPTAFQRPLEDAGSICKKIDTNLIGIGHLLAAIFKKYPSLFHSEVSEQKTEEKINSLLGTLRNKRKRVEGNDINVDNRVLNIISQVTAKGLKSSQNILGEFLKEARRQFPEESSQYFVIEPVENSAAPDLENGEKQLESVDEGGQVKREVPEEELSEMSDIEAEKIPQKNAGDSAPPQVVRVPFTRVIDHNALGDAPRELIGRESDLQGLLRILLRMKDPAVMLVGESGSGKSALLKGLAVMSLGEKIPALGKYVFAELDISGLINGVNKSATGTKDLTETIKKISEQKNIILLVDDIHLLLGQDGYHMVNDLCACFKPFLADGVLRIIFTTTPRAFDENFSADKVFANRTSLLYLEELSGNSLLRAVVQSVEILREYHQLDISEDAIKRSLEICGISTSGYRPPGSCVRLIDDAFALAVYHREKEVLQKHVEEASRSHSQTVLSFDKARLRSLEDELNKYVHGQKDAVSAVSKRLRLTKLQLDRKPNRPDGVFLFCGPSGVGKTEVAKACTLSLYGDMSRLIRLDMSEYMSEHEYSKIIGSPPGYVGYGEDGYLTGPVSKLGHAVILLDEIEKAHPKILYLLLQLFDEGHLTDGKGKRVDFSQCVVIMTSNMGQELWAKEPERIGFLNDDNKSATKPKSILNYLLDYLPSEFVNRIDEIILFRPLEKNDLYEIARRMLDEELDRWKHRGKRITYDTDLVRIIAEQSYNPQLGARHLIRNVENIVCQPLSDAACLDNWKEIQHIHITSDGEKSKLDFNSDGCQ